MATSISLKLSSRAPKKPIKRLPATVDVPATATIEDVKKIVASQVGIKDFNRLGLYEASTKKLLKSRDALVRDIDSLMESGELHVKDLGPQVAWRTVFIIEYLGPILIHLLIFAIRPLFYPLVLPASAVTVPTILPDGSSGTTYPPASPTQLLTLAMIIAHFLKREVETIFVHRFGASTMPVSNIFKNSAFYWFLSGLLVSVVVYSPLSYAALLPAPTIVDAAGLALFLWAEISNGIVHLNLASLRPKGTSKRGIPLGYGFGIVTCPNYMFEVLAWVGVIVVTRSWTVAVFIGFGIWQMKQWARQKEKAYREEFAGKYKSKRWTMLPGLF